MYSLPSASHNRAPAARSTTIGSPPTARKARTGLFTPPTRTSVARRKISRERGRSGLTIFGELIVIRECERRSTVLQPACHVLRVIGKNDTGAGTLDSGQYLKDDPLLLDPTVRSS